jgi:hypothetical protein
MPIRNPADGHGATLTFSGFVANITSISGPSWARDEIDTVHLGTVDWKTFIPADLADPGEISGECEFDPQALPPILGDPATLTIVWGNEEEDQYATTAFMKAFSVTGGSTGERMKASFTFRASGAPTITPGV